jgi:GntR family transcriptional regulator
MFLPVDPHSGLPIYRQVMDQVRRMVVSGALVAGDRIPSVRELSASLGVNPLTIAKAYQELERGGVVEMRRGLGVFVAAAAGGKGAAAEREARRRVVQGAAERLVLEAAQAGMGERELTKIVADTWERVCGAKRGGART